jgi:signal transduction histidine kinase/ActR/RegA family two-component response regulator
MEYATREENTDCAEPALSLAAGEDVRRFAFLAELSHVLSASLDENETLSVLARRIVRELADYCFIDVFDERGEIRRAVSLHRDADLQQTLDEMQRIYPTRLQARIGMGHVLRTGQPALLPEITPEAVQAGSQDERHYHLGRRLSPRSAILVPMMSRGRVLGAICLALSRNGCRYGPADLALAEEIGHRAALALDNARLYHEVQEALRRKDELLAMLAHELRNPLAAIANAGQALDQRNAADSHTHHLAGVIGRQVRHLSRLVDDLLDVSRFTRGRIELHKQPVELRAIVEGAVETARPLLEQRRHHLAVSIPEEPILLEADATRIEQALANLLDNAVKFTEPEGRIELTASVEGGEAVLKVKDNGPGIAPDLLPHIFDLFVQEDRSLARPNGGLGIGLTLARTLVEKHGGKVEAHSEGLDRGSELVVRLPLPPPDAAEPPEPQLAAPEAQGPARILLVEDNVDSADALAELLRLWGNEVEVVHDGATAVERACETRPDVVLLDIGLPGMDGYQVAGRLRSHHHLRDALLVALTGYGQETDRRRSAAAGFDHHLVKPVDLGELQRLLACRGQAFRLQHDPLPGPKIKERDDELVRR